MRKLITILSLLGLLGCGTQPELTEIVNDMVVLTNFREGVDFSQYTSYALSMDTVGLISNRSNSEILVNAYAESITAAVKRNLDATGHTQVELSANPDIGINVFIVNDLSVTASYNPYYFPGAGGYGYYGYGAGYGYTTVNYFEQAVLVIEFIDLKNSAGTDGRVVWVANIGDLVNSFDTTQKTKEGIDQAFTQSPFLKK